MKKILLSLLLLLACSFLSLAQDHNFTNTLYTSYQTYKEPTLNKRRIKHKDLQPLINNLKKQSAYTVRQVGTSIEGRSLSLISIGKGPVAIFLWSQMHGDEPTATQAIFDIFNFLSKNTSAETSEILNAVTLHFLPMLNPDGAEVFTRRNKLGVDINRDALRLQSPESKTLKHLRDSLNPQFGFNLHDQSTYYNVERTQKPATISYLAPAYNYEKDINEVRGNAMKVIVFMNEIIQSYAPGQVGRYNDDFEPRAFGDNIQKWGTSAILIESGGYANDAEKQEIRKLNYVSILSAIYTIAKGTYKDIPLEAYEQIPNNNRMLFDLKLENVTYNLLGKPYSLDVGIKHNEVDNQAHTNFYYKGSIEELGDLSTYYGYNTFDASGYTAEVGKVYPKTISNVNQLTNQEAFELLKQGYTYIKANSDKTQKTTTIPLHVVNENFKTPQTSLQLGANPTFLLTKNGQPHFAVVNGFFIDLNKPLSDFKNALRL